MSLKKKVGIWTIGMSANWLMVWLFDFVVYPAVIYFCGILWGGLTMALLSFVACYGTLLFYDWAKKDWIGIETIKDLKYREPHNSVGRLLIGLIRRSDVLAMIVLSVQFDPFITVAYLRHGSHQYNGLSARDWRHFIVSLLISNGCWTLVAFTGITVVEALWRIILWMF